MTRTNGFPESTWPKDSELKSGDRVRVIRKMDSNKVGDLGWVVPSIGSMYVRVNMDNGNLNVPFVEDELELIEDISDSDNAITCGLVLDETDPFESVLIDMVKVNRAKRADYAVDGSPWSNFVDTSEGMGIEGFGPVEAAEHNVRQKLARIKSLRANGRTDDPENESVNDTYLDMANYSALAYAIRKYPSGRVGEGIDF